MEDRKDFRIGYCKNSSALRTAVQMRSGDAYMIGLNTCENDDEIIRCIM